MRYSSSKSKLFFDLFGGSMRKWGRGFRDYFFFFTPCSTSHWWMAVSFWPRTTGGLSFWQPAVWNCFHCLKVCLYHARSSKNIQDARNELLSLTKSLAPRISKMVIVAIGLLWLPAIYPSFLQGMNRSMNPSTDVFLRTGSKTCPSREPSLVASHVRMPCGILGEWVAMVTPSDKPTTYIVIYRNISTMGWIFMRLGCGQCPT